VLGCRHAESRKAAEGSDLLRATPNPSLLEEDSHYGRGHLQVNVYNQSYSHIHLHTIIFTPALM